MIGLTKRRALRLTWCHVIDGVVHAAQWTEYEGQGCLTTLVESDATEQICCHHQTFVQFPNLGSEIRLWRDRASLALPICPECETDINSWETP